MSTLNSLKIRRKNLLQCLNRSPDFTDCDAAKTKHHKGGIVLASCCFQIIFDNKKPHFIWDYKIPCIEVVAIA